MVLDQHGSTPMDGCMPVRKFFFRAYTTNSYKSHPYHKKTFKNLKDIFVGESKDCTVEQS